MLCFHSELCLLLVCFFHMYSVRFSHCCGSNVMLNRNYTSAQRHQGYDNGVAVSSTPLPNDRLFQVRKACAVPFLPALSLHPPSLLSSSLPSLPPSFPPLPSLPSPQVEVINVDVEWSGSLMIGVASAPPHVACRCNKATEMKGQSFVIACLNGSTHLFVGGKVGWLVGSAVWVLVQQLVDWLS